VGFDGGDRAVRFLVDRGSLMALGVGLEVHGLEEIRLTLRNLPREATKGNRAAIQKGGQQIVKFWKIQLSGPAGPRRLGVGHGDLRRSIRATKSGDGVLVGTDKRYARIHEFGGKTRPHEIRPRVGKALAFFWPKAGGASRIRGPRFRGSVRATGSLAVFRKVRHPGSVIPKRPHREPAVRSVGPVLDALFEGNLEEALDRSLRIGKRLGRAASNRKNQAIRRGLTGRRSGRPTRVL